MIRPLPTGSGQAPVPHSELNGECEDSVSSLQLWGGVECTVNRVGDRYFDQIKRSGHYVRFHDLNLFADLGLRTLRYPALWEHVAPDNPEQQNWQWTDQRLVRLRELGISPIVGLLHHGSGPLYTSLLDPDFPQRLGQYAGCVANRYPWLDCYTPVNEPLTTARFSCLYGHWFPHRRDDLLFLTALINQCKGTILAMRAINRINPGAKLLQTEDLGYVQSTPGLGHQADFENDRRWLTWDLLCGRVDRGHRLWEWMIDRGVREEDLYWFLDHPCPPDFLGVNYYVTSERYLDEDLSPYPERTHGTNGKQSYADVETVRVESAHLLGVDRLLKQAWQRYELPMVVSEAHLGCHPEEQRRWLQYIWEGAQSVRQQGCDIRAVTAWSLLGSYDWCTLLTSEAGQYESGAFDMSAGRPMETSLTPLIRILASGQKLGARPPGWWELPARVLYRKSSNKAMIPTNQHFSSFELL